MTRFCSSCGKKLADSSSRFCPNCGSKLSGADPKPVKPAEEAIRTSGAKEEKGSGLRLAIAGAAIVGVIATIVFLLASGGSESSSDDGSSLPSPDDLPSGLIAVVVDVPPKADAPFQGSFVDCQGDTAKQDLGEITASEHSCAFDQAVAAAGMDEAPDPGKKYDELEETAMSSLLDSIWISGLAAEEGISVTKGEVADELEKLKNQSFDSGAEYDEFLDEQHYSEQDVLERVKLQILTAKLQTQIRKGSKTPTKDEIEERYEEERTTQYTGQPLEKVEDQIKAQLEQEFEQDAFARFVEDFEETWRSRTVCAPTFVIERCSNGEREAQPDGEDLDLPPAP